MNLLLNRLATSFTTVNLVAKSCRLLITFSNGLDPDQDRHSVGPVLDLNLLNSDSVPERIF